jgi:hypothetical protein
MLKQVQNAACCFLNGETSPLSGAPLVTFLSLMTGK